MSGTKQQFNIYLPAPLIRQIKHRAIDDQLSLTDWMEKMMNQVLGNQVTQDKTAHASNDAAQPGCDLTVAPLIYVRDLNEAIAFYTKLGAQVAHQSRDGDFALLQIGSAQINLLAHEPAEAGERFTLAFNSAPPLTELEARLRQAGITIARPTTDEGFGYQLQIEDPEGHVFKINQLEPELYT